MPVANMAGRFLKRAFDLLSVILSAPFWLPVLAVIMVHLEFVAEIFQNSCIWSCSHAFVSNVFKFGAAASFRTCAPPAANP